MSDSVRPHRQQPTRLPCPWDSPGQNTGVDCHFLLQCMKVKSESEVVQLCPTLSDFMDRSLPGSSIHGIFQARVLEWTLPSPKKVMQEKANKRQTAPERGSSFLFQCLSTALYCHSWRAVPVKEKWLQDPVSLLQSRQYRMNLKQTDDWHKKEYKFQCIHIILNLGAYFLSFKRWNDHVMRR